MSEIKTLREIAVQLKRIADTLMMIEMTLMRTNGIKYTDLKGFSKDYNKETEEIVNSMDENRN